MSSRGIDKKTLITFSFDFELAFRVSDAMNLRLADDTTAAACAGLSKRNNKAPKKVVERK